MWLELICFCLFWRKGGKCMSSFGKDLLFCVFYSSFQNSLLSDFYRFYIYIDLYSFENYELNLWALGCLVNWKRTSNMNISPNSDFRTLKCPKCAYTQIQLKSIGSKYVNYMQHIGLYKITCKSKVNHIWYWQTFIVKWFKMLFQFYIA